MGSFIKSSCLGSWNPWLFKNIEMSKIPNITDLLLPTGFLKERQCGNVNKPKGTEVEVIMPKALNYRQFAQKKKKSVWEGLK